MITLSILSAIFLIIGFLIVVSKLLHPYHFRVGISLMGLSTITLIYSVFTYFKLLSKIDTLSPAQDYILQHKGIILLLIAIFLFAITALTVAPIAKNPFRKLSKKNISDKVQKDLHLAITILDQLEISGNSLINNNLLSKESLDADERKLLQKQWINFLVSAYESEKLTETHCYFHFISLISQPKEHAKSFMISYSLYLKKFEIISSIMNQVQSNESVKKILNEKIEPIGKKNIYSDMAKRYYKPKTVLRINLGQGYLVGAIEQIYKNEAKEEGYETLKESTKKDYLTLKNRLGDTIVNSAKVGSDTIEKGLFDIWFPIQKNIAKLMGSTYLSSREDKFITTDQIYEMGKVMEPGDIMLQRRNWYGSNVGIPGFWAHAALYTGTLEKMNRYFESEFPYNESKSFSEYLEKNFPKAYEKFGEKTDDFPQSVIEGKDPGVILQPLEISASADYLVTLRPKLSKKDKMLSLFRAFGNFGKPYDFNFDFETKDAMVCSELVYDAYLPTSEKKGVTFPLSLLSGRKIMAPVDIAKKFVNEYGDDTAELEFVYFLDGDEGSQSAEVKDVEEFIKTPGRPKYSWFLD